jgi:hypothetical protein
MVGFACRTGTVAYLFAMTLLSGVQTSTSCPQRGCPASERNVFALDGSPVLILPEQAVEKDFSLSVRLVEFVYNNTPGPSGSQFVSQHALSFHINQRINKPITVRLRVSNESDRVISSQPFLHWWWPEERSWKVLAFPSSLPTSLPFAICDILPVWF